MARPFHQNLPLPDPIADGNGGAVLVEAYRDKLVQVTGTFTATVTIQGSLDGSNWVAVTDGAFTGPGFVEIAPAFKYLRAVVSGYASGAPVALFGGFDERTD